MAYSETLAAAGDDGTWSIISGTLTNGLALNPMTGVIDGHPVAAGISTFTVAHTSSGGQVTTRCLTIEVT